MIYASGRKETIDSSVTGIEFLNLTCGNRPKPERRTDGPEQFSNAVSQIDAKDGIRKPTAASHKTSTSDHRSLEQSRFSALYLNTGTLCVFFSV